MFSLCQYLFITSSIPTMVGMAAMAMGVVTQWWHWQNDETLIFPYLQFVTTNNSIQQKKNKCLKDNGHINSHEVLQRYHYPCGFFSCLQASRLLKNFWMWESTHTKLLRWPSTISHVTQNRAEVENEHWNLPFSRRSLFLQWCTFLLVCSSIVLQTVWLHP